MEKAQEVGSVEGEDRGRATDRHQITEGHGCTDKFGGRPHPGSLRVTDGEGI